MVFKYLGSTVTNNNRLNAALDTCMSNAFKIFGKLRKQVWLNRNLSIKTKCAMYHTIVLSILICSAEIWMVYKVNTQRLHIYMMHYLCKTLNIKWWQHIQNKFILKKSKLPGTNDILTQKCAGHLNRLEDSRLPKQILGGPKLSWGHVHPFR